MVKAKKIVWVGEIGDIRETEDGPLLAWATVDGTMSGNYLAFKPNAMQKDPRSAPKPKPTTQLTAWKKRWQKALTTLKKSPEQEFNKTSIKILKQHVKMTGRLPKATYIVEGVIMLNAKRTAKVVMVDENEKKRWYTVTPKLTMSVMESDPELHYRLKKHTRKSDR